MINKLLGAAAMAAMIYPTVPASAANVAGCNGGNLEKTESAVEVMPDGAGKIVAQKEMAQVQDALLAGNMGACAMHLSRAMHPGTMPQACMRAPWPKPRPKPYAKPRPKPRTAPRPNPNGIGNRYKLRSKPRGRADCVAIGPSGRRICRKLQGACESWVAK